jgi:hypothetical protein
MIAIALQIAAFVLFIIAAIGIPAGRYSLMAAGLACWVASALVGHMGS